MEIKKDGLFINCKFCGEDVTEATPAIRLIGICRECQYYREELNKEKPKRKVKYKLG